ncbi:phosphoribosylglycinamide formyltransferase [Budviciaceae bacterium BWR-B9]|uniref:Phosphoribosylglycinamide formyltransferase n=1 Tax=Limnobaculum allomyrinae TaxID=2791986 RepID=A0ABS1ITA3_9GAMM|nr:MULTISPECIES: phosphoribosylglycinamide formyltransferase [Limnobaculum]MBK5144989.1 phosphoribosylglycinamide formyltransferase [Limnobaculum allomyrinae]MBV7692820.1 phosphoribosylglycinamide formyltransferase [Limnobaculum sp. M2-1]
MKSIVVLISGSGSNLQAIIDACDSEQIDGTISAVFSNVPEAYGLVRAQQSGIITEVVEPKYFSSRTDYDLALADTIDRYKPDLIVLAGYMRILSPVFVNRYAGKLLNIHPSLLPKYPGLHTHSQALSNGDKQHGATIHFVTEELDGGPIILQAAVPVLPQDSEAGLIKRVQVEEHRIYPLVVSWFMDGRLAMRDGKAWMDNQPLPPQGYTEA